MEDCIDQQCYELTQNLEYFINEGNVEQAVECASKLSEFLASVEIEVVGVVVPEVSQPTNNSLPVQRKRPNLINQPSFISKNNAVGMSTVVIDNKSINPNGVNNRNVIQPPPQGLNQNLGGVNVQPSLRPVPFNAAPNQSMGTIRIIPPPNAIRRNNGPVPFNPQGLNQNQGVMHPPPQYNAPVPFNPQGMNPNQSVMYPPPQYNTPVPFNPQGMNPNQGVNNMHPPPQYNSAVPYYNQTINMGPVPFNNQGFNPNQGVNFPQFTNQTMGPVNFNNPNYPGQFNDPNNPTMMYPQNNYYRN